MMGTGIDFATVVALVNLPIVGAILTYVVRIESRLVRLETLEESRKEKRNG